jgi:hypothetical protein
VAYFRRQFGNYTHTDALLVGPSDYDPYCINAPNDARLPTAGQQICGLYDVRAAARPNLAINRLVDFADTAKRSNVFNGFDYTMSAHLRDKLILGGGASTGRVHNVNCETFDSPDVRFCDNTTPWLTQVKLLASYRLPYSLQVSATFQSVPGPALSANYTVTNATAAANGVTLGRAFSGGSATIALIEPNTLHGDRLNQTDLRFARIFNYGRYRLQGMIDIYNVFNRRTVLAYNTTFGQEWLRPTDVLQGRLVKIGGQLTF